MILSLIYDNVSNNKTYLIDLIKTSNHDHQYAIELNYRYFSYYKIIEYIGFESIIYIVNLDIASSSKILSEFDYIFLSNILIVLINKINFVFFQKKESNMFFESRKEFILSYYWWQITKGQFDNAS